MGFYENVVLPAAIHIACGSKSVAMQREKIIPLASGLVLEVGAGTGLNFSFYDPQKLKRLFALEPSEGMRRILQKKRDTFPFEMVLLDLPGEEIPLEDKSIDTIVLTYTLCSIPGWQKALEQMRRVLKPSGRLLFSEHGLSPDARVGAWQNRLNPVWKKLAGGCHLNRPIRDLIAVSGFEITHLDESYLPGTPRFAGYNYRGAAKAR